MEKKSVRGSTKVWERVFDKKAPSNDELNQAVTAARGEYTVKRWWKYGQPAIDLIKGTIDVTAASAGTVIQDLLNLHGQEIQVNLDVFPYGITNPEGVYVNVTLERKLK